MLARFIVGAATLWGAMLGFFVGIAFGVVTSMSWFFVQSTWYMQEEVLLIIKHHAQHILAKQRRRIAGAGGPPRIPEPPTDAH
jgi:hypothetical protein